MAEITRDFTIAELEALDVPHGSAVVFSEEEDTGRRWLNTVTCVFKAPDDGHHYSFEYSVGKTEYQEMPWHEELGDTVKATRVTLRQVKVDRWLPVEADGQAADS